MRLTTTHFTLLPRYCRWFTVYENAICWGGIALAWEVA
jgi:hypothetical protein